MKQQLKGTLALLGATVIWGSAFIAQSVGMDHIGPMTFQASRCFLGAVFLVPVIFLFEKDKKLYFHCAKVGHKREMAAKLSFKNGLTPRFGNPVPSAALPCSLPQAFSRLDLCIPMRESPA